MRIGNVPRCKLGEFPTPLQKMGNLSNYLGGPEIFIKRDDLNGLGVGGNKLRKLEFAMADAQKKGATVVITTGAVQTNHGRLTLAAANKLGLSTILVLVDKPPTKFSGNILLDRIMGVEKIYYVDEERFVEEKVNEVIERLENIGEVPYFIPGGCGPLHGTLGYAPCVLEIVNQLFQTGTEANYVITACGTASTQAGLVLGSRLYTHDQLQVVGISVSHPKDESITRIASAVNQTAKFLELHDTFDAEKITVYDNYIGEGYAIPTKEMKEAVELVGRKEGIVLDPVYTGKAMAGLIDLIQQGKFDKGDVVVFLHTGGIPGLFAERQADFFQ